VTVLERAYGRPAQIVAVDVALRKAVEGRDPAEALRVLRDMRDNWVAQLSAPVIEMVPEELPQ
jgi:hypothetical protein